MPPASPQYLLDTNILVHHIRDDEVGERVRDTYRPLLVVPTPIICVVTDGELRSLAVQFNWGRAKIDKMEFCLGYFRRVTIDEPKLLRAYAAIDAHAQRAGHPLGKNDAWIAATAAVTGARLVTTDRDFLPLDPLFLSCEWIDPDTTTA